METWRCDVLIVGGGVAGLWAANRLQQEGWQVALLENAAPGSGQTLASQGIIHGGVKYGIDGTNREIAQQLKALPPRWEACFEGRGEIDLTGVQILAREQYLWSRDRILGAFASAMAQKAMQGEVAEAPKTQWPAVMQANPPSGSLYAIRESILNSQTLVTALAAPLQGRLVRGEIISFLREGDNLTGLVVRDAQGRDATIAAGACIFTAGRGNERAAQELGWGGQATQRRPLRMVVVRGLPEAFYGHCVTASPKPRVTITSHPNAPGLVWYLGGEVAEKVAGFTERETLANAQSEMRKIFPSLPWETYDWAGYDVDRAEPSDPQRRLPMGPRLLERGNTVLAWPTKLVYAPLLADQLLAWMLSRGVKPGRAELPAFPVFAAGQLPWQQKLNWTKL